MLLTPDVVTDAKVSKWNVNAKVQCLWGTPSQPSGRWRGWRWKSDGKGRVKRWELYSGNFVNVYKSTCYMAGDLWEFLMLDFSHGSFWWHQLILPTNHFFPPSLTATAGLTWCHPQFWTLVFNASFTDFGISNDIPLTTMYCTRPVTLEFGLRTIPFWYLHSAD